MLNQPSLRIVALAVVCFSVFVGGVFALKSAPSERQRRSKVEEGVKGVPVRPQLAHTSSTDLIWVKEVSEAPWAPRDSGAAFVFQNKLWMLGGLNGNGRVVGEVVEYWKAAHFNDIWNTEDGVHWQLVAPSSPWPPRRSMSVVSFRGKLWMLGGWSPVSGYTNDIWVSEDGLRWKKVMEHAPFPPVEGQTLTVVRDKLWKIGGVNYDLRRATNDVYYSEDGFTWKKVENIPWGPRWDHAVAVFQGKLFLAGGMDLQGNVFNDVWVSEDGLHWKQLTNNAPWAPRQGHALEVYNGKLWIIGRLNDKAAGGDNDMWFSTDGVNWRKATDSLPWKGREDFFSAVFKNKIWVFGGMDADWRWRNDVWSASPSHP